MPGPKLAVEPVQKKSDELGNGHYDALLPVKEKESPDISDEV
jgi:hypothetical protein